MSFIDKKFYFISYLCKVFSGEIHPKWSGILNPLLCRNAIPEFHDLICELKNVAVVYPKNQYFNNRIKCPIYELSGFFLNAYGTLRISNGFKSKEKLNQAYLRMREVGIIDRMSKKYGLKKDALRNFQDHYSDKYKVHIEGVMFDHVKIIVIGYFMFLTIPLTTLLIEILIFKIKNRQLRLISNGVFDYIE